MTQFGQSRTMRATVFSMTDTGSLEDESDVPLESRECFPHTGHSYLWTPPSAIPSLRSGTRHSGQRGSLLLAFANSAFTALEAAFSLLSISLATASRRAARSPSLKADISSSHIIKTLSRPSGGARREGIIAKQSTPGASQPPSIDWLGDYTIIFSNFCSYI